MSKKGKRLREFEKKNRTFSVRETKPKDSVSQSNADEVFDIRRGDGDSSGKNENSKKKKTVINVRRLALSSLVLVFVVSVSISAFKLLNLKSERDRLTERQTELEEIKEELNAELEHIDSAEYIEQQARKNLRLIKKNEILFILSDSDKNKSDGEKDGMAEKESRSEKDDVQSSGEKKDSEAADEGEKKAEGKERNAKEEESAQDGQAEN